MDHAQVSRALQPTQPSASTSAHHSSPPPAKRTKLTSACLPCRRRKVKCDGSRPICARCTANALTEGYPAPCEWGTVDGRSSVATSQRRGGPAAENRRQTQRQKQMPKAATSVEQEHFFLSPSTTTSQERHPRQPPAETQTQEPAWYGPVGRSIELHLRHRGRRYALGTASVGPLAFNIQRAGAVTATTGTDSGLDDGPVHPFQAVALEHHNNLIFHSAHEKLDEADYELPRRAKADALLAKYWDVFHPVFPTLDVTDTTQAYNAVWNDVVGSGSHPPGRIFLSIINMTFALASRVDTSLGVEAREKASARYCGRALELLNRGRTRPVSVPAMQAALLVAEYLHSLHPEQCWMYAGMAIRMAQSLGLHRPATSTAMRDPRAARLCLRLWKLCVVWDRILCMTYGRSLMVSQNEASWCLSPGLGVGASSNSADDDRDETTMDQPEPETMVSIFLDRSLEFYMVMGRALDDLASLELEEPDQGAQTPAIRLGAAGLPAMDKFLRHEQSLADWQTSLPSDLIVPDVFASTTSLLQQRHAVILHQRLSQARTALLRPLLSHVLHTSQQQPDSNKTGGSLARRIAVQCAISCVAAAQETIRAIDAYHCYPRAADPWSPQEVDLTNAWWNNVLYLYSAATALLAARLCPEVGDQVGRGEIDASWALALRLFRQYDDSGSWVRQLAEILRRLSVSTRGISQAGAGTAALPSTAAAVVSRVHDGQSEQGEPGNDAVLLDQVEPDTDLLMPMIDDPMMFLDGELPLFSQAFDLDAILCLGNNPFAALGNGSFGG
ncbi:fungal-specific transcription factor domain-containing protein [Plectosphaerella plurivora]|uniref:Fungal-specific transcription factor domain-containing protein n=1 Tax=Plectosphaerella plurivora TaxID=936078 RepID=A0A9P8VAM8_9PEZI|nr:fungal-specific transcription factor domain-containing protein [Plectosphaerella plurivora]